MVGLDLSLTGTGIAVGVAGQAPTVTTIKSAGAKDATLADRVARLRSIEREISCTLNPHLWEGITTPLPALFVIEAPAFASKTGHAHDRSGLWWLLVERLHAWPGIWHVVEVTPSARAKSATGRGNAGKDEVLAAVVRRYPDVPVANNNEADALVLAAMGSRHLGHPIDNPPKTNLAAMDAVHWPTKGPTP